LEPLSGHIGALISDLDLTTIDPETEALLKQSLQDHLVLFFRDQQLAAGDLYKLASKFGTPAPYPFVAGIDGYPEIVEVKKQVHETVNFGGVWHSDTAYLDSPAAGAMLYGVSMPPSGGDTIFSSMYAAYDCLSTGMKALLEPLTAVNNADKDAIALTRPGQPRKNLTAEHPVIRTHPGTGRKLLFVNRAHTTHFVGMTEKESEPLLEYLFELIETPEISCRFQWSPGSLAFWDNRACQHYPVNDYQGQERKMLRISLSAFN
jgi:taurine dioxygenase